MIRKIYTYMKNACHTYLMSKLGTQVKNTQVGLFSEIKYKLFLVTTFDIKYVSQPLSSQPYRHNSLHYERLSVSLHFEQTNIDFCKNL